MDWCAADFTTACYPPAELDAAFEHWQFLHAHDETHVSSRMWHRSITVPESDQVAGHGFVLYTTDLRCEPWKHSDRNETCLCVGELMYQASCEPCEWSGIADRENDAVDPDRVVEGAKPLRHTHDFPLETARSVAPSGIGLGDWVTSACAATVQEGSGTCRATSGG